MTPKEKMMQTLPGSIIIAAMLISATLLYNGSAKANKITTKASSASNTELISLEEVAPKAGVTLPVVWGDLGARLIESGAIDQTKFETLYEERGGLSSEMKQALTSKDNGKIVITKENSGVWLNLLWAAGLATKNPILESGPIQDKKYGGAGGFASTGGWTLSKGDPMDHFNKHDFISLTKEQQELVQRVASNIYRPCCDNPTHFPDCNHGMAMLGLLEMMAAQGVSEKEMYKVALEVNSYWFPDTYQLIASFLKSKGQDWGKADPKDLLGPNFSSASASKKIRSIVTPPEQSGGGVSCGA